jgi:hypothetical protein
MDSGLVDLNDGFGLNLPDGERISYRRRTTCAVLSLPGHTSVVEANDLPTELLDRSSFPGEQFVIISYGSSDNFAGRWKNVTVLYSLLGANFQRSYILKYVTSYTIQ